MYRTDQVRMAFAVMVVVLAAPGELRAEREIAKAISPAKRGFCRQPIWSRDGSAIAYERQFLDEKKNELCVLTNLNATPVEETVRPKVDDKGKSAASGFGVESAPADGDICRELAWGPAKGPNSLIYSCNVEGSSYQLFWRPEEKRLDEGERVTSGLKAAGQPAFGGGWQLAFVSNVDGHEGIFLVRNFQGSFNGKADAARARLLPISARVDRMPTWDPAGKALAFVGHSSDTASDIFVTLDVAHASDTLVQLTDWPSDEINPSWSPDGTKIAFYSNKNHAKKAKKSDRHGSSFGSYGLYVVDAERGAVPYLLVDDVIAGEGRGPSWTPDGKWIVYVKDRKTRDQVDPLRAIKAEPKAKEMALLTGTTANEDPDITGRGGEWWLTFTALGFAKEKETTEAFRRVYIFSLADLKAAKLVPAP